MDAYSNEFGVLVDRIKGEKVNLEDVSQKISPMFNGVTDPKVGLITQFNCKFIRKELDLINDAVCGKLIPSMGNMSMVILAGSIFLVIGQYLTCILHRNISGEPLDRAIEDKLEDKLNQEM